MRARAAFLLVVNDDEVKGTVAVRILQVDVSLLGDEQPHALLLSQTDGEPERVLAPVGVPAQHALQR